MKKITGHLEEKNGKWYAAVNHYGPDNKRHAKWYSLDIETKRGNKRRAEVAIDRKAPSRRFPTR